MERVAVIGCAGAGKSTLARHLGTLTGLPVIHLDREHWLPGWVEPDRDEWAMKVGGLVAGERWIIDGNYGGTIEQRVERADMVVFMDYSRWICLFRVIRRTILYQRKSRPDMAEGCQERFDLKFYKWIWNYRRTRRPGIMEMLRAAKFEGTRVVVLRNPAETKRFRERC